MKVIKRLSTVLLLPLLLCHPLMGMAFASSEEPAAYEYEIAITAPDGWYRDSAELAVTVRDVTGAGYERVELQAPGSGFWTDITGSGTCEITANGTYTVRVTAPDGQTQEVSQAVECFDTTAPAVTAGIRDKVLHAEASDAQSGVYGLLVDDSLYTTLEDGCLDLRLEDYTDAGKAFSIIVIDNMGNQSEVLTIDNPYYVNSTPAPEATPASTPIVIYTGSLEETQATATPAPVTSTAATAAASTSSAVPVSSTTTQTVQDTTADEEETDKAEEEISLTDGTGFSSNGNAVTRDLLYDQYANKQFITVQTRSGETFYLVIDYDKVSDEDAEVYQTYFLNPVDDEDLLALLDDDAITALTGTDEGTGEESLTCTCTEKCVIGSINTGCPVCRTSMSECVGTETATPTPEPTAVPEEAETEEASSGTGDAAAVILFLAAAGGGAFYFLKHKKTQPKTAGGTDLDDYDFGEDEEDEEDEDEGMDEEGRGR